MSDIKTVLKKGRKFDQVLDAARVIFMAEGYEGASMDDIAAKAQVSKATVYSYFPDKSLLFVEATKAEIERITQEAEAIVLDEIAVEPILRFSARTIIDFYMSNLGKSMFRVCVAEAERFPELGKVFYEAGPKMGRERLGAFLAMANQSGLLTIEDTDLAADQFSELCRADLFSRVVFGLADSITPQDIERVINGAIETFLARYGVQN